MMTKEMMMTTIESLGEDADLWVSGNTLNVDLNDFEGFTSDWDEIDREYDDPEAVNAFLEMLGAECTSQEGDFYITFHFDGFDVVLGYASFDI